MGHIINSLLGIVLVALFLGGYAIGLKSIPFAIIVVGVLALIAYDFIQTVKQERNHM